jgi:hypothetical protein
MDTIFGIPAAYVGAVVRHGLTAAAGALVAGGYATGDQATTLVAGAMAVIAIGWSWWQKRQHAAALAAARSQ